MYLTIHKDGRQRITEHVTFGEQIVNEDQDRRTFIIFLYDIHIF